MPKVRISRIIVKKWVEDLKQHGIIKFNTHKLREIDRENNTQLYRGGQYINKAHISGFIRQLKKEDEIYNWEVAI